MYTVYTSPQVLVSPPVHYLLASFEVVGIWTWPQWNVFFFVCSLGFLGPKKSITESSASSPRVRNEALCTFKQHFHLGCDLITHGHHVPHGFVKMFCTSWSPDHSQSFPWSYIIEFCMTQGSSQLACIPGLAWRDL